MTTSAVIQSIISGASVILLAAIGKGFLGVRKDFRRFLAEHTWLLATTLWNRDKVIKIMAELGMPITDAPPNSLPDRK